MTAPDREREAREKYDDAVFYAPPAERDARYATLRDAIKARVRAECEAEIADLSDTLDLAQQEAPRVESDIRADERSAWRAAIEGMRKERPAKVSVPRDEGEGEWLQCVACELDEHDCLCKHETESWNAALAALAERMGTA